MKYEAVIGSYSFLMEEEDTIEVWGDNLENPETYIFVKKGDIKNEKQFQEEVSFWYIENIT